jgi:hypothetical protein
MAFFHSFFDESGKFKDHRVISFCGVVAAPQNLHAFNHAWDVLLRKNQLKALHTTHAFKCSRALSPIIRDESPAERCESLKPFIDCIHQHLELGVAIAIDVAGYSSWSADAMKRVGGSNNPAYLAFLRASLVLNEYAYRDDDHIGIMCDDDEETAWNFYLLYRRIRKISGVLRKKFVSMAFADDNLYPALQAADLIAGLVRLEALRRFNYHTYDYKPLFDCLSKPDGNQQLKWSEMFANKAQMRELGPRMEKLTPK